VVDRARHRQGDHPQGPPVLIAHGPEPLQVLLERFVVLVRRIGLHHSDDGRRIHEAGQIVDVTVGVVAGDPVAQPEDVADTEMAAETGFDGLPVEAGIAVGVEEAGLGRQQGAAPVDVDGPALEHHAGGVDRNPVLAGDPGRNHVVEIVGRILATPGIVAPVQDGLFGVLRRPSLHEDGAMVPAPGIVGRVVMEVDVADVGPGLGEQPPHAGLHRRPRDVDVNLLPLGEQPDHPSEDAWDRAELAGPGGLFVRPTEPGAAVRLPLGGHAIANGR
jgi:hypothetical protein